MVLGLAGCGSGLWNQVVLLVSTGRLFVLLSLAYLLLASASCGAVSVGQARLLADGASVQLADVVVTAYFASESCVYVEDPNREAGIRVPTSRTDLIVGDVVDVSGVMATHKPDGIHAVERKITSATITKKAATVPLKPLAMNCFSVGGGPLADLVPGVRDGVGTNNVGLLVKIAGRVTNVSGPYMWVDDGSGVSEINGNTGVFVECPSEAAVPIGSVVGVVGISQGAYPAGWSANRRYIHMRDWNDLRSYTSGAITGAVRDSQGAPLAGVTVATATGGYTATTALDGTYSILNVHPGTYTLTASRECYGSVTRIGVAVTTGGSSVADFSLIYVCTDPFVANGDFEHGFTGSVGTGWSTWQGSWSNAITFAQEPTAQLAGLCAQKWGRSDNKRLHGGVCLSVPTVSGVMYEVSAWLCMDAADSSSWLEAGVDLTGQIASGEAASVSYTKLESGGNRKWLRYRRVVTATGSSISFFSKFGHSADSSGPNWAYVDNVSIQPRTVLEAEDYANAYDTTSGNTGGVYRSGDVDITSTPDGGGYAVGWTASTEWIEWTNVGSVGGEHVILIDYSAYADSTVHVNVDGTNVTGSFSLPKSGWWDSYRRVVSPVVVSIASGTAHTVRLTIDTANCNIDRVTLIPIAGSQIIQAENYSAFHDTTTGNSGGNYRTDDVDIYQSSEGCYVGAMAVGEWLDFPVCGDSRTYIAVIRYAGSGKVNLAVNGNSVTGSVTLPSSSWKTLALTAQPFTLSTGSSTVRLSVEQNGAITNYIALIPLGDGGAGSNSLVGVHFAGNPSGGILDMASGRGAGQWIYSTEVYATDDREPEDPAFIANMTDWITGYLRPMYQNRIRPIARIDYIWGETVPRLLSDGSVNTAAVGRYARTFKKVAQIADANGVPIRQFVVANEMNLRDEGTGFTNGYIPEWYYAYVYDQVAAQMASLGGGYEVLVGGLSPGTLTPDPLHTPPDPTSFYQVYSVDAFAYLDNVCQELKRRGTANVGFALHAYNDFDNNRSYTTEFYWTIRKQLEVIERSHTVVPYGQTGSVTVAGYTNAPIYITEWNRHTPQSPTASRAAQETATSGFVRTAIERLQRWNRNREVYDNVSGVYRTYDHRSLVHNFHPIKGATYFVFDTLGGAWGDYSLKEWHTLADSATGSDDMYTAYESMIGWRDPGGR